MLDDSRRPTARTTKDNTDQALHRAKMALNDEGNAERLKTAYGDDIIYIANQGWAVWRGSKYDLRQGATEADKIAAKLSKLVPEEASAVKSIDYSKFPFEFNQCPVLMSCSTMLIAAAMHQGSA